MHYIDVVIDNKSNNTDTFFTYAAPDEVTVGARLTVPFARRKKPVDAYCIRENPAPSYDPSKIREIESWDPDRSLTEEMISTAVWMRRRYGVKFIDAVKMFTVAGKRPPQSLAALLSDASESALVSEGGTVEPADAEHIIVNDPGYTLSEAQQYASDRICSQVRKGEFRPFLIKGVTNSGKTEVYMRAAEEALRAGKTVIVLLPEIALSAQMERRFKDRFGEDAVATLHSRLKTSARLGEWLKIRKGIARIVVGARTAVFAPLENIGAIIIDEEHETTYKSDHNPKYETVDIA